MPHVIVFDLDGTLALNDHRQHLVEGEKKDWDAFFEACDKDTVNEPIRQMLQAFFKNEVTTYTIVIASGRSEKVMKKTIDWLLDNDIYYDRLMMRPEGDYRPDTDLKRQWLRDGKLYPKEEILLVVDDRQSVVDMWRSEGLTCLQVAEGKF